MTIVFLTMMKVPFCGLPLILSSLQMIMIRSMMIMWMIKTIWLNRSFCDHTLRMDRWMELRHQSFDYVTSKRDEDTVSQEERESLLPPEGPVPSFLLFDTPLLEDLTSAHLLHTHQIHRILQSLLLLSPEDMMPSCINHLGMEEMVPLMDGKYLPPTTTLRNLR